MQNKYNNPFIESFLSFSKEELLLIIKKYEKKLLDAMNDAEKHAMFTLKLNAARVASVLK